MYLLRVVRGIDPDHCTDGLRIKTFRYFYLDSNIKTAMSEKPVPVSGVRQVFSRCSAGVQQVFPSRSTLNCFVLY